MAVSKNTPLSRPKRTTGKPTGGFFAGPAITLGSWPKPPPALTEEQKALIEEYLDASEDAEDAATFGRMFGTLTAKWQRAIERGQEATAAIAAAGITQAMISAHTRPAPSEKD